MRWEFSFSYSNIWNRQALFLYFPLICSQSAAFWWLLFRRKSFSAQSSLLLCLDQRHRLILFSLWRTHMEFFFLRHADDASSSAVGNTVLSRGLSRPMPVLAAVTNLSSVWAKFKLVCQGLGVPPRLEIASCETMASRICWPAEMMSERDGRERPGGRVTAKVLKP